MKAVLKLQNGKIFKSNAITIWSGPNNTIIITCYGKERCPDTYVLDAKEIR